MDEFLDMETFEMPKSRVYILLGDKNTIVRVEGEYSLPADLDGWVLIDEGFGDRYNLAQSHYFDMPLVAEDGTHNYIYDGCVRSATDEEKEAEKASFTIPESPKSLEDKLNEMQSTIDAQNETIEFLNDTLLEVLLG